MQTQRPWYVNEQGELDVNAILSTIKPVDEIAERYKALMLAGKDDFCIVGNVVDTERAKAYDEVYNALSGLLDHMPVRDFVKKACPVILKLPVEMIGTEAAQKMARLCLAQHAADHAEQRAIAGLLAGTIREMMETDHIAK